MSGHSKWSQIKRQKQAGDLKRGAIFSKLANQLTAAAKQDGADPGANFKLRLIIEQAKKNNMPLENVERAIKRAAGDESANLEEITYEAYGPGGAALVVKAVTDNKKRTLSEVKNTLSRFGGRLGTTGCTAFLFQPRGELAIVLAEQTKSREDLEMAAIDAGAIDFEEQDRELYIYTEPQDLESVENSLESSQIKVTSASVVLEPKVKSQISDPEQKQKVISLVTSLDGLDDVSEVYCNADLGD